MWLYQADTPLPRNIELAAIEQGYILPDTRHRIVVLASFKDPGEHLELRVKTIFITLWGRYHYLVISAGAADLWRRIYVHKLTDPGDG